VPASGDRQDAPTKSLEFGSGSPLVRFLHQAKAATILAPLHREILVPQNEAFRSAPETPKLALAIDQQRVLSESPRI
jgi:hypothetical protein